MMESPSRPTRMEINLTAIQHNIRTIQSRVGPAVEVMAVVKANGYGHGAVSVARAAIDAGATWLGVATLEEGLQLRQAGLSHPILVFGSIGRQYLETAISQSLDMVVYDLDVLQSVSAAAERVRQPGQIHLKIDTGMGRVGLLPEWFGQDWVNHVQNPNLRWRGLMSHLADSDGPDETNTREQLRTFLDIIEKARQWGALPRWIHLANSAAAMRYPGTWFNLVRVGIAMYGGLPYEKAQGLQPALTWRSNITHIKRVPRGFYVGYGKTYCTEQDAWIVNVPVGYADGYRRTLSNLAQVLIRGHRYPVVGRISMDQLSVAIPVTDDVAIGDDVVLIGQDGDEKIRVEELANTIDTISYEIFTGISDRVPRLYGYSD